jgi:nitroreductase
MNTFDTLSAVIRQRRSSKPAIMNGKQIDNSLIESLLELADWAPTHGRTEPWRFIVYAGAGKQKFCKIHADIYRQHTPEEKFMQSKYDKLQQQGDTLSHIIVVATKRTVGHVIPMIEEEAAVAAAMQNILLGAAALNIAALWSTGGMTHHPALKKALGFSEEDLITGLLFLGYTDDPVPVGKRSIPLAEKVQWHFS